MSTPVDALPTHKTNDLWSWIMIALSFLFLVAYSALVLEPNMPAPLRSFFILLLVAVWAIFIVAYVIAFIQAKQGWRFISKHWLMSLSILVPVVRPFLLLNSLNQLEYFRRRTGNALRVRIVISAVSFAALFIYVISLTVLRFERDAPGANILSFGDAIWWAFVTIATVGYGDMYPVTVPGRFFAVILMMGGVFIVGIASALVVSYITEHTARALKAHKVDDSSKNAAE